MEKLGMGNDEIQAAEAAKLLEVDLRTLQAMVRQGLLQPATSQRNVRAATVFRLSEVSALVELRGKRMDLAAVANIATRAYVISKGNEKKLDLISDLLGLTRLKLEVDETSVVGLYLEAEDTDPSALHDVQALRRWAAILYSIDEAYLRLVERCTGSPEPWRPFFDLAQKICEAPGPSGLRRRDVEAAYIYLEAARRNLRAVMYIYYREKHGPRAADRAFPEMQDQGVDAELAAILYPA